MCRNYFMYRDLVGYYLIFAESFATFCKCPSVLHDAWCQCLTLKSSKNATNWLRMKNLHFFPFEVEVANVNSDPTGRHTPSLCCSTWAGPGWGQVPSIFEWSSDKTKWQTKSEINPGHPFSICPFISGYFKVILLCEEAPDLLKCGCEYLRGHSIKVL